MALSKKPYRGTRDFFPSSMRVRSYLFSIMKKTAKSFGFEEYDGPLLEETDLYRAKSGEELINDQIYSFQDRGERDVAIRPEMTPTLARMVSNIYKEESRPIRWFSIPNVMRYERPQKGRLREHWQLNCDIFGANESLGEIELFQLIIKLFKNFGASEKHFEILINDRKIVDALFNSIMNVDDKTAYKLYKIIDRHKKISPEKFDELVSELNLETNATEAFKSYMNLSSFKEVSSFLEKYNRSEILEKNSKLFSLIEKLGLSKFIKFDPSIVRGLDYYTGVVFEVFDKHPENRRALCGGGAYENLLQIFNEGPLKGIGLGLGDVTLADFLSVHNLMPDFSKTDNDVLVSYQSEEALDFTLKVADLLRDANLKTISVLAKTKVKKVFSLAEKKGASFAVLIGDDELSSNSISIKNLSTKDQKNFPITNIEEITNFIKA